MKILVGTNNIANNALMIRDGMRELGLHADAALTSINQYYASADDIIDISSLAQRAFRLLTVDERIQLLRTEYAMLLEYDVYIFICSTGLLPGCVELPLLKDLSKIVIFFNTGSDQRHGPIAAQFYQRYDISHPPSLSQAEPNQDSSIDKLSLQSPYTETFSRKLHSVRMAEYYADAYITLPSVATLNIRPFMSLIYPMKTLPPVTEKKLNDPPVLIHAPCADRRAVPCAVQETIPL